jgi:phospholipid/cholesterol/gamma-HCH transport system substrate-binding protein
MVAGLAVMVTVLLAGGGVSLVRGSAERYEATFVFPYAGNLITGSRVQIDGFDVGKVTKLEPRDGRALVRVSINDDHAPLHAGTSASIGYLSFLGERVVEISPGAPENAPLPAGAMITSTVSRVELDDVLNALDEKTREALSRLAPGFDAVLDGREDDLGATLESAGPALDAMTKFLQAMGEDGPALRRLLTSVRELSQRLVARREAVRGTIDGFDRNLQALAEKDAALRDALDDLPATLRAASAALGRLPGAVGASVLLLDDLRPGVEALAPMAADLRPFLAELRPTLAELRPMMAALGGVLAETPGLLDRAHSAVPATTRLVTALLPAIDFLRPYTPELVGSLTNFGSASANYDKNGHYLRIYVSSGSNLLIGSPDPPNPTIEENPQRRPGELEGQPLTDATGSKVR